ncbi:SusC/RagA family TonB-linked outer membrane protein [Christiangramia salexigens]|uniref:SusC/RagA family TonB-linked outer membrane protein n=1 Tax=Christiangramia salexigens TaxID=1913577 RepID=A0A1L3J7P4_9FLAO|nr:SusC/RagA family TonB-linked outer membrane protein [Christiangramia salexigens]APG61156.1 SusC/RagA family TonB-linked outer membrane protein [Christiangramia salexigens]
MKTKFSSILTLLLAFVVQMTFAQQRTVSGTVTDEGGLPLPGVNIVIKGTSTGVQTDFDGNYSVEATQGDVLVFSFVGLETAEVTVGSIDTIDLVMKADSAQLDEVVVTALGIKREKQSLGYAQQTVEGESLVKSRETNINNALAGKVAGIQFKGAPSSGFGNSNIRLRGDTGVLYIVDNVKVQNPSDIITDDIADMSVLKGAAATALYGPQGKNGVIIITTKSAAEGQSTISVNHSTAMENIYVLPEYQNEYGGGYSQDFNVFTYDPSIHPADWASFDGQQMVEYYADESWGPRMEGQMVRHWDSWIPGTPEFGELRPFSPNPDNVKNFFDTGYTTNTNLTIAKGGEGYAVRASLAKINRTGIIPNSSRNQVQGSINATLDITDKLTGFANVNYQDRRTENFPENGYGNISSNFNQWWQRQLDMDRLRNYRRNGQIVSWNLNSPTNITPLYWDMPFFDTYENLNAQTKNSVYGRIGLSYEFSDDLNASVEARKTLNTYEANDRFGFGGLGTPFYAEGESMESTDELFGILNYETDLSDDFDVSASVGFEIFDENFKSLSAETNGGLTAEGFYSLNTSRDRPSVSSYKREIGRKSTFAKASIGYQNLLYLDGSARLDWQSTANADANRVETYGASMSFIFSKVLPQNDVLTFGKLRASIAEAPLFPDAFAISETYNIGTPYGSYGRLSVKSQLPNPNLIGGVRQEYEIGTEMRFLDSRVGFDVTYFNKVDDELPVAVSLDPSTGYSSFLTNSGKQTYKGWEFALNVIPVQTADFTWNLSANLATLERRVDKIADGTDVNVLAASWRGIQLQERVGEEWGAIYGRAYRRDENGEILLSSTGSPRYDTNQYLGNILPDFTGGASSYMTYKNFSLGLDFDFQKGGKVFSVTRMFNAYSGLGTETIGNNAAGNPVRNPVTGSDIVAGLIVNADNANADTGGVLIEGVDETSGNPAAYYVDPAVYWGRLFSLHERWLYDATYVKLRQARLDYTVPSKVLENTFIKDVNVGVFASNLWLIYTAVDGIDVSELEDNEATGQYGWTEGGQSPNTRTVGLNVNITF